MEHKPKLHTKYGTACFINKGKGYYFISSSKEGNRGKALHRLIYEDYYNTKIPEGMQIHHLDEDTTNNDPLNLKLVSISEHNKIHKKGNTNTLGFKHSDKTKEILREQTKERWANPKYRQKICQKKRNKHASIIKGAFTPNGKRRFILKFKGKVLKSSVYPHTLVDWFTQEYPNEILKLTHNRLCSV